MRHSSLVLSWLLVVIGTAALAWFLVMIVRPWLIQKAMVSPTERSNHVMPTPQGAGIAVVGAVLVTAFVAIAFAGALPPPLTLHVMTAALAAAALMVVGLLDDMRSVSIFSRLGVQALAVAAVVATLPADMRLVPEAPIVVERAIIFLGGIWFVNLYNFMDGVDLMTVTQTGSIGAGIVILALLGFVPEVSGWVAAALIGGMFGFAFWNFPPARIFLGDAGSLPLGLIVGTLLMHVALADAISVAIILPLYYLLDASVTLTRRVFRRASFWGAHREHFYQSAGRNGFGPGRIVKHIAALNAALIVLALVASHYRQFTAVKFGALFIAVIGVIILLRRFTARP